MKRDKIWELGQYTIILSADHIIVNNASHTLGYLQYPAHYRGRRTKAIALWAAEHMELYRGKKGGVRNEN